MLMEPLINTRSNSRRPDQRDTDVIVLTVRAYDLGVPVMDSTATVRIYPPESKTREVTFVVPGRNPNRMETQNTLSALTGGRVIITDIRDHLDGDNKEKYVILIATNKMTMNEKGSNYLIGSHFPGVLLPQL